ncbi:MAG: histidine phosphotransferase family protein [Pseudomonadota bacterium]
MSSTIDLQIAEIWCSKLCHDLVSPVGAVCNGVEFLQDSGAAAAADASDLIAQSANMASDRLQFYRSAYGAAGSQMVMSVNEACQTAGAYLQWSKTTLQSPGTNGSKVLPEGLGKVFLNVVALLESGLVYGGDIEIDLEGDLAQPEGVLTGFSLTALGRRVSLSHGEPDALAGEVEPPDVTPRTVHAYMTGIFARHLGKQASLTGEDETRLSIRIC